MMARRITPAAVVILVLGSCRDDLTQPESAHPTRPTFLVATHPLGGEVVHVKFASSTAIQLRNGQLVSLNGQDIGALKQLLSQQGAQIQRMFSQPEAGIGADVARLRRAGADVPDLNLWHRVTVGPEMAAGALVAALRSLPSLIDEAYIEPPPVPPPTGGDYTARQGYASAAPDGIGAQLVSATPGATGANVKVVDIEYSWNQSHEDLSKATGALVQNGIPVFTCEVCDNNHGTAVLGVLVADKNSFGVTGIAPDARLALVNVLNTDGYQLAEAINLARLETAPGDVIVIEQNAPFTPANLQEEVPVEWVPAYYDAIKVATADGRIVVESAGNGGQNLDDPKFGKWFPRGKKDSGAIIVGAGNAPGCTSPARSRSFFPNGKSSTYGSRVDMQGWGECVVTTGYGDLFPNGGDPNSQYTETFSGTSSANPIVAGAAAALSSAIEAKTGRPARPADVRKTLVATGTPQAGSDHIGPLPDLVAAFKRARLSTQPSTGSDTWAAKALMPTARVRLAAGVIDGSLYAIGGLASGLSQVLGTVEAYDPLANTWTTKATLSSGRWHTNGVGVSSGLLYLAGGIDASNNSTGTLFVYDPSTDTWATKASMPAAGGCGVTGVIAGYLYVTTGCANGSFNSLQRYDPGANTWTTLTSPPSGHREGAGGVINGRLYLAGGVDAGLSPTALLHVYDPANDTWSSLASMPTARQSAASAAINGKLYIMGGFTGTVASALATVEVYDPATNTWATKAPMPTARFGLGAGSISGLLYAVGGQNSNGVLTTNEAYTP